MKEKWKAARRRAAFFCGMRLRREPGWSLRLQMPSMPCAGGGSFGSAAPKEPKVPLFRCSHVPRSRAKSLIKTGRLHPIKSNVPASPNTPSPTSSVRAASIEPPYPFCHALSRVLKGLTAGLRTVFRLKGKCGSDLLVFPYPPSGLARTPELRPREAAPKSFGDS